MKLLQLKLVFALVMTVFLTGGISAQETLSPDVLKEADYTAGKMHSRGAAARVIHWATTAST